MKSIKEIYHNVTKTITEFLKESTTKVTPETFAEAAEKVLNEMDESQDKIGKV